MSKLYQDYCEVLLPRDLKYEMRGDSEMREEACNHSTHVQWLRGLNPGSQAGRHHVAAANGLDLLHQAELGLRQQLEMLQVTTQGSLVSV